MLYIFYHINNNNIKGVDGGLLGSQRLMVTSCISQGSTEKQEPIDRKREIRGLLRRIDSFDYGG